MARWATETEMVGPSMLNEEQDLPNSMLIQKCYTAKFFTRKESIPATTLPDDMCNNVTTETTWTCSMELHVLVMFV